MNKAFRIQFILYNMIACSCLILASRHYMYLANTLPILLVITQISAEITVHHNARIIAACLLLIALPGILMDCGLMWTGTIIFATNPFAGWIPPPWMMVMWVSFAVSMYTLFYSLFMRYTVLACLGLLGFSLAYSSGARLGAAYFPFGYFTAAGIGMVWAILLPLACSIFNQNFSLEKNHNNQ